MQNEDVVSLVERAVRAVEPIVGAAQPADHARATPCPEFNLGSLLAHLIGGLRGFADVGEGKPFRFDTDPNLATEIASVEFRRAADRVVAAFRSPDAMDRSFDMPWGATTAAQLLGFELIELIVHGWDLSRALGRADALPDELVEAALFGAKQWVDESARTPQLFGPEVPVRRDAPAIDRLVGFLGRSPTWSAA